MTKEKAQVVALIQLASEAYDHLEGFESGCECDDIGFRCIKCLRDALRIVLKGSGKGA